MNNPFNKPFNEWTIDDFQNALKITWNKQVEIVQIRNVTPHFSKDVVELERGETLPKPKDNKHTRMKAFHKELQAFIDTITHKSKKGALDVKTIKKELSKLSDSHPVNTTYKAYLEKCRGKRRREIFEKWGIVNRFWKLTDYDRLSKHLSYMKGFYTEFSHKAKLGYGGRMVSVYKRYILVF